MCRRGLTETLDEMCFFFLSPTGCRFFFGWEVWISHPLWHKDRGRWRDGWRGVMWGERCLIEREELDLTAEDEGWKSQADRGNKRNRWRMSRRSFFFSVDAGLEKLKLLTGFAPAALFICWSEGFPFAQTHTHTLNYHVNSNLSFWWSSSGFHTFNTVWCSQVYIYILMPI